MTDWSDRTAEEREAARLERERRRDGRPNGRASAADELDDDPEGRMLDDDDPEGRSLADDDDDPEDERLAEHDDDPEDEPLAEHDDETMARPLGEPNDEAERPSGTRRVTRLQRPRRPTPARRPQERSHKLAGRLVAVLAIVFAAAAIWFLVELFQPFHGSPHGSVEVTIPPHTSSRQVGDLLARDGVVSSGLFFELRALLSGDQGKLRSGTYHLALGMSYGDALKALTTAPPAVPTTNVTIIPGRTRRQVSDLLQGEGVKGSYLAATRRSPLLNPAAYGAPRRTDSLEGFLFPDTYQVRAPLQINELVAAQLRQFRQEFATVNLRFARSRHMTPYDVLIIASMIDAEAGTAHDRPLVSSVIYNRLRLGMPLQLDSTTRYATGNYTRPLTESQLNSPSPYNTRNHTGLTPTPIDNPSLSSIEAAAHPAPTNDLYFVVKPCGNGSSVFTSSYSQFEHYEYEYYVARQQHGGNSPEHC